MKNLLKITLFLSLFFRLAFGQQDFNPNNKEIISPVDPKIQYMGRIDFSNPEKPLFSFPNVSIKTNFEGTSISCLVQNYDGKDFNLNYFYVLIDEMEPYKLLVQANETEYELISDLPDGEHTLELIKITESANGQCEFLGFKIDSGKTLINPPPKPERKIEFIGNSITCGYCIEGGERPDYDNSYRAYAAVAARQLNAQFFTTSYSGMGMAVGWGTILSDIWEKIIPDDYTPAPPNNNWDFGWFVPDVVVIVLGTNDWHRGIKDGSVSIDYFKSVYRDFLYDLKSKYPEAIIVCTNSPMLDDSQATIDDAVKDLVSEFSNSDVKTVYYFGFSKMQGGGSHGHPGVEDGLINGTELAIFLESIWPNMNTTVTARKNLHPVTKEIIRVFPNPFNPITHIHYRLTESTQVKLDIYDVLGRKVKTLVNRETSAGAHSITWDGTDNSGSVVSSGVYMCWFHSNNLVEAKKIVFLQ